LHLIDLRLEGFQPTRYLEAGTAWLIGKLGDPLFKPPQSLAKLAAPLLLALRSAIGKGVSLFLALSIVTNVDVLPVLTRQRPRLATVGQLADGRPDQGA
jgi:hypothetical protein